MSNNDIWPAATWAAINGKPAQDNQPAVAGPLKTAMGMIRVAQQIFPTTVRGKDDPIPADTISLKTGEPTAGITKPVATITKTFKLADIHIKDPDMAMTMNQIMLAAQSLALAEDALFFRGMDVVEELNANSDLTVTGAEALGTGLLGKAEEVNKVIQVFPSVLKGNEVFVYGSATYKAVTQGLSIFANVQAKPFALILDPITFADANIPLQDSSIVTPASAIKALMDDGHFTMSPSLPPHTGLLVALGGKTTQLYVGTEPIVEWVVTNGGISTFTARESIQFHNIDARSLIRLDFKTKTESGGAPRSK